MIDVFFFQSHRHTRNLKKIRVLSGRTYGLSHLVVGLWHFKCKIVISFFLSLSPNPHPPTKPLPLTPKFQCVWRYVCELFVRCLFSVCSVFVCLFFCSCFVCSVIPLINWLYFSSYRSRYFHKPINSVPWPCHFRLCFLFFFSLFHFF